MSLVEMVVRKKKVGVSKGLVPCIVGSWRLRGSKITVLWAGATPTLKPKTSQERPLQPKLSHEHRCKNP